MSKRTKPETGTDLAFRQGFYCAVATLIKAHGCDVEAWDVFRCMGKADFTGIDPYDVEVLKPMADEREESRARRSQEP